MMQVIKRSGRREEVSFDKITARLRKLTYNLDTNYVNLIEVSKKVIMGLYDGVTTVELDNLAAETAATMATVHPDYALLAARIAVSNLHKETEKSFGKVIHELYHYIDPKTGDRAGLIGDDTYKIIMKHKERLESAIIFDRDFEFDYFGFKTLERSYLMRMNGKVVERPQHLFMRVAVGIHQEDIDAAIETYNLMSERWFIHATPTLFNAGTPKPQLSSCFLLTMTEDSIAGIFETLSRCALISQSAGGIGLSIHNIRATGSYIKGTGGTSNGIIPMLRVFNDAARYVDQCFHPDTLIYTRQGIKRIDDIVTGEELLTAEGDFNRVTRLLRNTYEGNMVEIGVKHSIEPILVTPGHTFLVLRGQKKMVNHEIIANRLEKGFIEPEWVEAKDLTPDDLIAFPIPEFFEDIPEYSPDDCRFYGMMIGDGHIARDGKAAHITQNRESDDINFVKRYLYENGIRWTESANPEEKKIRFTWSAHLGFKFSRAMLYNDRGEKQVHPSMLHLPKEKTLQIVKGILETDGSISNRENFEIALDMTSRNVIESVRYMLMRFGILTSGYVRDRVGNVSVYKNITTRKVSYCLRIPKVPEITDLFGREAGEYTMYFTYGNHTYSRITHLAEQPFDGVVVDFEVEPNHNYVTHIGVAHNGGGKRKGAFAVYLEPWHADVFEFLELKKNHGKEEMRARDLFYALWISDLFMERVKADKDWSLFDPNEAPGLFDVYGAKFEALYHQYEQEGRQRKTVKARELWNAILESQTETGTPYILYKDAANKKSNQQNLGTIRSSNLCCIAADQRVPTEKGMLTIGELYADGTKNNVVGRERIETASEMFLPRPNAPIVNIVTAEGYTHKVTPDHKVWVDNEGWREAQHLLPGDKLLIQQIEGLWGSGDCADEAFLAGLVAGDGTFGEKNVFIDIWDNALAFREDIEAALERVIEKYEDVLDYDHLTGNEHSATYAPARRPIFRLANNRDSSTKYRLSSSILFRIFQKLGFNRETKLQVPNFVWTGNKQTVSRYLEGLYLADGTVQAGEVTTCSLASVNQKLLADAQMLWANFGVKTSLTQMRVAEAHLLPDGKGGQAEYQCQSLFRLMITSIRGCQIAESVCRIGQYRNNQAYLSNLQKQGYQQKMYATFERLEVLPNEDAYCLLVDSEEHSWTVNGLITKNTEIIEYTSKDEVAVCNLASLALPKFVRDGQFDFEKLFDITRVVTRNLNKVIDINYYPIPEARNSNFRHRPIGLGVQGLADAFILCGLPFDSEAAKQLNKDIFETIYFAAVTESANQAEKHGAYETFKGSPMSKGMFQFDLWGVTPSKRWDWDGLRERVKKTGLRNSLLVAPMPTASTSQILGNNECFEPYTSNLYTRRTLAGEHIVVNKHLMRDLVRLGLWNEEMREAIMAANGSIQGIEDIPKQVRDVYKTAYEISQKVIIDMSADRGAFICQSQSLNIFMESPTFAKLSSMHFYAWQKGLKTGMYYLRSKAATDPIKFTLSQKHQQKFVANKSDNPIVSATIPAEKPTAPVPTMSALEVEQVSGKVCSIDNPDCEACSA